MCTVLAEDLCRARVVELGGWLVSNEDAAHAADAHALPAAARRALALEQLVVKEGSILWIADAQGDIRPSATPHGEAACDLHPPAHRRLHCSVPPGLYHSGTRFLSCCAVAVAGHPLPPPAAAESQGYEAKLAFPELSSRRGHLSILRTFLADGAALAQWVAVETQTPYPVPVSVTLTFGVDFRELPDRPHEGADGAPPTRGSLPRPMLAGRKLRFAATDSDGGTLLTTVAFDRLPCAVRWLPDEEEPGDPPLLALTFRLHPALAEPAVLGLTIAPGRTACATAGGVAGSSRTPFGSTARAHHHGAEIASPAPTMIDYAGTVDALRRRHARHHLEGALYHVDHPELNASLHRGAADLALLIEPTSAAGEMVPVASLPERGSVFGRDALLAAIQTLALDPQLAVDTLRLLARHQITPGDTRPGSQPGRIPYALARGTAVGDAESELDVSPAALDTTPLWVALLAETVDWTGDLDLLEELLPAAWRALSWIDGSASHAPNGYLACRAPGAEMPHDRKRTARGGVSHRSDGHLSRSGDWIAPAAAQAYAYRARRGMARLLRRYGQVAGSADVAAIELAAERQRERFERDFWLTRQVCYAEALDAAGKPIQGVTSSSAAHVLWTGLAGTSHAAQLAHRLLQPDLFGGWGLRARSLDESACGSSEGDHGRVSTLDTALAAAGFWRTGHPKAAARLAQGIFTAAAMYLDNRLPEYLPGGAPDCAERGTARGALMAPGPAACPAASSFGMLSAMLGAEPDALARRLVLRPILPAWIAELTVQHLRVGSAHVELEVRCTDDDGSCVVRSRVTSGELHVVVRPPARIQA
jgi:glycogen debranching enzyme